MAPRAGPHHAITMGCTVLAGLFATLLATCVRAAAEVDDFEGLDSALPEQTIQPPRPPAYSRSSGSTEWRMPSLEQHWLEVAGVALLLAYAVNFFRGRRVNEALALHWASTFCVDRGVIDQNFALIGPGRGGEGEEMLMKASQDQFELWASGRRHCKGALITLNLQPRHDLIQLAAGFVTPRDDTMTLEVYMNEGSMPPTCLAVGLPRMVKHLQSVHKDLETYARPVNVPTRTDIKDWPAGSLSVVAESSAAFQAFFCRPILDLAFGKEAYQRHTGPYFRWLHISSEFTSEQGGRMRALRFSFKLPEWSRMGELNRLLDAAMKLVDVVGAYEMPDKAREQAEKARESLRKEEAKEERKKLDEQVQKKRQEKQEAEQARLKRLKPAEREKEEARLRKVEQKRMLKKRTVRV